MSQAELFFRVAACLTLALVLGCAPESPAPRPDRDVVLIVIDTLRADHLGCYGHDRPTSPVIDGLAAGGVRCASVTAQSSWTAPSMVSLMTSRELAADFKRMPDVPTLAERLAAAGYRCVGFQDNILLAPGTGFDRGFELYEVEAGPAVIGPALARDDDDPRPLFAYFHFVDPHDPYAPLPQFDRFEPRPEDAEERWRLEQRLAEAAPDLDAATRAAEVDRALEYMRSERALYEGDVLQTDKRVEFVLQTLNAAGRRHRALVILAADHGECLWQQPEATSQVRDHRQQDLLALMKGTHNSVLYESLTGTPLILAGPDLPAGTVLEQPVTNMDIVPTVLDWLGLPADEDLAGESLLGPIAAAAAGVASAPDQAAPRFANTSLFTSVVQGDLKLILPWDRDGPDATLLFDLAADPREQSPLALDHPAVPGLVAAIEAYRRRALLPAAGEDEVDDTIAERMRQLGYLGGADDR